jgi:hypothetical protein
MKHPNTSWVLAISFWLVLLGPVQAADRFSYTNNGSEVVDNFSGLVWQRCVVGMHWNGLKCTGSPSSINHQEALLYAQTQNGWRLPNIKELNSILEVKIITPAYDTDVFSSLNSAMIQFWSSTPYVASTDNAWFIDFQSGKISYQPRTVAYLYVRLVR